jgi:hypothetical protein
MDEQKPKRKVGFILNYVAVWQFLAFILLLCVVWISEVLDLPFMFFRSSPTGVDIMRGCTLSAAVIVCAIIAVGNTYVQQKHVLKGMLILCSSCNKVKVRKDAWEGIDDYLEKKTLATLAHDVCPDCLKAMEREIAKANVEDWKSQTRKLEQ